MAVHMPRIKLVLLAISLYCALSSAGHAQSLKRQTVYIQNPTSKPVYFSYRMGGDEWKKCQINSGYTMTMTGIADHYISHTDGKNNVRQYKLSHPQTVYFSWINGVLWLKHR